MAEIRVPHVIVRQSATANGELLKSDPLGQLNDHLCLLTGPHLKEATLLFALGVARYAGLACSAALTGASGVGKTFLANTITDLMPSDDVENVIDVTYAVIAAGFKWGATRGRDGTAVVDVRRKLLLLDENSELRKADTRVLSALRQSTSTKLTTRMKIVNGQPERYQLLGPLSLLDCRLNTAEIDYQTANRMTPIGMIDSPDALDEILRLTANKPTAHGRRLARRRQEISAQWRSFLGSLHPLEVVIDFADQLLISVPGGGGRITHGPRILSAVHGVISAVAWLRQHQKHRHPDPGGSGQVIFATRADYRLAREILCRANVLDERPNLPAPALNLLSRWQPLAETTGNEPVTAAGLFSRVGIHVHRGNITRHLRVLIDLELASELASLNMNRQKQYELTPMGRTAMTVNLLHTLPAADTIEIPEEANFNAFAQK